MNSALLDYFLTSCHVTTHFLSLKRFLLLEDGEFAHTLSSHLFNKVSPYFKLYWTTINVSLRYTHSIILWRMSVLCGCSCGVGAGPG